MKDFLQRCRRSYYSCRYDLRILFITKFMFLRGYTFIQRYRWYEAVPILMRKNWFTYPTSVDIYTSKEREKELDRLYAEYPYNTNIRETLFGYYYMRINKLICYILIPFLKGTKFIAPFKYSLCKAHDFYRHLRNP